MFVRRFTDSYNAQELQEVSSEESGGKILFATDDFFAVAENLLAKDEPKWNDDYTEFGKWMDGWETQRKRTTGHDWAIIQLAKPTLIRRICVDTAFFSGNFAPRFSVQAACLHRDVGRIQNRKNKMGTSASKKDLKRVSKLQSEKWRTLVPMQALRSGISETRKHYIELADPHEATHIRLNIYPDGGIARLRIYGKPLLKSATPSMLIITQIHTKVPRPLQSLWSNNKNSELTNLVAGRCIEFSDAHYGHPDNLMNPWPSKGMHDGWETARRSDRPSKIELDDEGFVKMKGEEWVIFHLSNTVMIRDIEVDTTHFKGNCPDSIRIEGAFRESEEKLDAVRWRPVLQRTKLLPNKSNGLKCHNSDQKSSINGPLISTNLVKVTIAPDGGLARLRIYGVPPQYILQTA
ncbi:hypothetical protein QAD02_019216 [Eretmocerus hayati]|uniref:Uncharacterized protein n=1 Tax=Eretmocerus hayati TaxID=131215 RepID=A0ACC2PIJ7_9HYME|nr:hypothetical protein QAD02_019216 [Eretmocerus hayati]